MEEFEGILCKDDLVRQIAQRNNYNQADCKKVVDTMIDILRDCITERKEFSVRGLGRLKYTTIYEHEGSKPTRGIKGVTEKIWIPETESVRFLLASDLRNLVKETEEEI